MSTEWNKSRPPLRSILLLSISLMSALPGCPAGDVTPPQPSVLTTITISPAQTSIAPGTTIPLVATGTYSNNSHRVITTSVTWSSSDTTIASVSNTKGSQGVAAATLLIGSTNITASLNGISGMTSLSTSPLTALAVVPDTASVAPLTTQQFVARGTLASGNQQNLTAWAAWTASDTTVANINEAGLASAGTFSDSVTINATYSAVTGTGTLFVSPVAAILLAPASATIAKGTTQQFSATGTLINSATQPLTSWATWASSNVAVATVSDTAGSKGLATGAAVGVASITAAFNSQTSSAATLTVTEAVITSITVTPANASAALGQTEQFLARATLSDATTQDISMSAAWNSSNTGVAVISASGVAEAVGTGTTIITASSSGITSNAATLTVSGALLESITVTPLTATILISSGILTEQYTALGTYTNGDVLDISAKVTWSSSKPAVAAINSQGLATAPFYISAADTTLITATLSGITSNSATLTVRPF